MPETDGTDAVSGASRIVENGDAVEIHSLQRSNSGPAADLFQIETTKTYPSQDALVDEASQEQDRARPELSSEIDNFGPV